jgi:hypothetical protein
MQLMNNNEFRFVISVVSIGGTEIEIRLTVFNEIK